MLEIEKQSYFSEKRWIERHRYEQNQKKRYLKRLSQKVSINILKNLYKFAYDSKIIPGDKKLDMKKIITLGHIHSIFRRIKQ